MVAREAARSSFDEVVETVRELTGATIAKRQVEELTVRAAQDFEAFYEQRAAQRDPSADLLVISTGGKGIVMRHEDLRKGTRRAADKGDRKLQTRLTPGEKSNRKRMAQVANVYSIAPFVRTPADIVHTLRDPDELDTKRPRSTDKRVWARRPGRGSGESSDRVRTRFARRRRAAPNWETLVRRGRGCRDLKARGFADVGAQVTDCT